VQKKITDESVKLLRKCHIFYLSNTGITDESVKFLGNCHTLNLSHYDQTYHDQITDESINFLGNCHALYLTGRKIRCKYKCI